MQHEMSHQWFGDLVTTAWWDDIWLNEAFASWLSTKLLNEWKPEWNMKADAARSLSVMRADSLVTTRKIRQQIEAPGDIANAFDGITYGKGEAVIGMFENYVGPETFQRAIRLICGNMPGATPPARIFLIRSTRCRARAWARRFRRS